MLRYRTEIVIAADHYVCLQLPDDLPEGRATVTVHVHGAELSGEADDDDPAHRDPGRQPIQHREDIEWWEEFDEEPGR